MKAVELTFMFYCSGPVDRDEDYYKGYTQTLRETHAEKRKDWKTGAVLC